MNDVFSLYWWRNSENGRNFPIHTEKDYVAEELPDHTEARQDKTVSVFNCYGKELFTEPVVAKESYYTLDADGNRVLNYRGPYSDQNGFDIRNREENGSYYVMIELPRDTMLIRYGNENGRFTAPEGAEYENLGLPYIKETIQFHKYKVIADSVSVFCKVQKGIVAPVFDSPGGAVQYLHDHAIMRLIRDKILERTV